MLVSINGTDITSHILANSYEVNSKPIYKEWTDANYTIHRSRYRDRVSGKFDLKFSNLADYQAFVELLDDNTIGSNEIILTVYVNNIDDTVTKTFFWNSEVKLSKAVNNTKRFEKFAFEITEK